MSRLDTPNIETPKNRFIRLLLKRVSYVIQKVLYKPNTIVVNVEEFIADMYDIDRTLEINLKILCHFE